MENLTQKLFNIIANAPDFLKNKYFCQNIRIIDEIENLKWYDKNQNLNNAIFSGLKFVDNNVYVINIGIIQNDFSIKYLDISNTFKKLLKTTDLVTISIVINAILKKYYKEFTLSENIIEYIQTYNANNLTKFNHKIKQNNERHRKFIDCNKSNTNRQWNNVLHKTALQIINNCSKQNPTNKRPPIFNPIIYTQITKLCNNTNCY